jgi:hypothetical protein
MTRHGMTCRRGASRSTDCHRREADTGACRRIFTMKSAPAENYEVLEMCGVCACRARARTHARTHARTRPRTHARALQVWSSRRAEPAAALCVRRSPHLRPLPGLPHLCQDGRIAAICSGTGLTCPHPHRDWARWALSPSCWRWMAAAYAPVRIPSATHSPHLTPSRFRRNARTRERVPLGARRGRARDTLTCPSALKASCGARVGRRTRSFPHWGGAALRWGVQESLPAPTAPHRTRRASRADMSRSRARPSSLPAWSRCGPLGQPGPGADVAGVSPVPVQMWQE